MVWECRQQMMRLIATSTLLAGRLTQNNLHSQTIESSVWRTIVAHEAHWLCKRPLGSGIGGETPVVHCKACGVVFVLQVFVELSESC